MYYKLSGTKLVIAGIVAGLAVVCSVKDKLSFGIRQV